jgi:hypothetical protein
MMDRAEWTRQIEAEVAELRRDLAEARMPAPRSRKNYVECLTLLPQLTNAELEQLKLALLAQAMERGDAELCREFLSNVDACPCCGRWMGVFIVVGLVKPPVPVLRRAALMRTRSQDGKGVAANLWHRAARFRCSLKERHLSN